MASHEAPVSRAVSAMAVVVDGRGGGHSGDDRVLPDEGPMVGCARRPGGGEDSGDHDQRGGEPAKAGGDVLHGIFAP